MRRMFVLMYALVFLDEIALLGLVPLLPGYTRIYDLSTTEAGALLIESLARSNDQQLAGAIIFLLTASIVTLNFLTDILLALIDPRIRKGILG